MAGARIRRAAVAAVLAALQVGPPSGPAVVREPRPRARLAKTKAKTRTASGAWVGEYAYAVPMAVDARVPFNAVLHEDAGAISGTIDEPNTFGAPTSDRLYASVAGARNGSDVFFIKKYSGAGSVDHAVDYDGVINDAGTRIDGTWDINGFRGRFFMERADVGEEAAEEREAEAGM